MSELPGSDLALVREQIGREPLTRFTVVARCGSGHPLVIRNHPLDVEEKPFPTLYWLTCPEAVKAVSRLEADGWIKRLDTRAREDRAFGSELDAAHREYAEERGRWLNEATAWGGVGGSRAGLKCLHAHYANHLAGGEDPVGRWVADRVEPFHPEEDRAGRVAAVDIGTNSIRLLVASPSEEGGLRELARDMVITRLGEGVDRSGSLSEDAVERTIAVLARYARRASVLGAGQVRVAATSAVRDAENAELFERRVRETGGASAEVLTGEEEALISFLGATFDIHAPPPWVVVDIGGGSTEVIRGGRESMTAMSVDMGSVRLTERVHPSDPPSASDLTEMRELARKALGRVDLLLSTRPRGTLVGVAGTTTTVQAVALGLDRYAAQAIHGTVLHRQAAEEVMERLASMTTAQRRGLPVMPPGREDVIVAGGVILLEIMDRWGYDSCIVSERDILDGLVLEMVSPNGAR